MNILKPVIWILLGARAGDNAQAIELARRIGGTNDAKQLLFNKWSGLPNALLGAGFKTLAPAARKGLVAPWPDIVIATGRRTAPVNLAIKQASGGRTLAVHIGRPRMPLQHFDLVVTTPQYGLPPGPTVMELNFPFATAKPVAEEQIAEFLRTWGDLPRPWIAAVIGAEKYPVRFGHAELNGFAQAVNGLASRVNGSVILMDSPRSTQGAIASVAAHIAVPHWLWTRGQGENPYQAGLALADQFAVTSDSVSMVSEMVQTGKPTHVYDLPIARHLPSWSARSGFAALLARQGWFSPPRSVAAFRRNLEDHGWIGNLQEGIAPAKPFSATDEHAAAVARVIALWCGRAAG